MSIRDSVRYWKWRHRWRASRGRGKFDAIYVGGGIVLTRLASRRLMYVVGEDRSLTPSMIATGAWESRITKLLTACLRPGMSFLDVGANFGYFSLMAADLVGRSGLVTAIEANPVLADLVVKTLQINGHARRTRVHNVAVDDKAGQIELRVLRGMLGSSSMSMTSQTADEWNTTMESVTVKSATIDELVGDRRLDVMKIDVEGAELLAFRGAEATLRNNPRLQIIMEYSPSMLGGSQRGAELLNLLQSHGFRPFRIGRGGALRRLNANDRVFAAATEQADLYLRAA